MAQLLISDIDDSLLERLRRLASVHGRTLEEEVRAILTAALRAPPADPWAAINAFRERLAASGRDFGDSAEDIREDRDR
jgi:plasmid stability protein